MNTPPFLKQASQGISEFWSARNERERKQMLLAAVVVVLALIYMVLIEPAYMGRKQLEKNLPALRQQAIEMQGLASQATSLSRETPPAPPEMTKESIAAAMARAGLPQQTLAFAGDVAKVQLSSVSFSSVVRWLDDLQKSARVNVVEANITPQPEPDIVNATLTLRQQKSE